MCDIFSKANCKEIFQDMFILMIGDSNMKSYYKDVIYLITHHDIAAQNYFMNPPKNNRRKSFCGDRVISLNPVNGRDYCEDREFIDETSGIRIRFVFVTNVFGSSMKRILNDLEGKTLKMPNVILMNSCLWDLTRWGPKKEEKYMENLISLFGEMRRIIPPSVLTVWTTTPPLSCNLVKGGVFIKQLEFTRHTMRFMVIEANSFVRKLCIIFEKDLLDIHYHLRYQVHRRSVDGIHWEPQCLRHVVCLILTHIAISFKKKLPGNFTNDLVTETLSLRDKKHNEVDELLPAELRKKVNEHLKVKEPAATVSLKAIKVSDSTHVNDSNNVRHTKKIRRRLRKDQLSSKVESHTQNEPLTMSQCFPRKQPPWQKSNISSRLNYHNMNTQPYRLPDDQVNHYNYSTSYHHGIPSAQPNVFSSPQNNLYESNDRRRVPYYNQPQIFPLFPHDNFSIQYDPNFWNRHAIADTFSSDNYFQDKPSYYRF